MRSPDGIAVDAQNGAMMNECINVQLHLCYSIGVIARTKLLVSLLLRFSSVPTLSTGASGESIKGGVVSLVHSSGNYIVGFPRLADGRRFTLAWSSARNKSASSDVICIVLPLMLGMLARIINLRGSNGRLMLLHAVRRTRKVGEGRV